MFTCEAQAASNTTRTRARSSPGRATSVEHSADTSTLDNIVISNRLEWKDAPDDSLEFTAAQAGNYAIDLTGINASLGVSALEYRSAGLVPFTRSACPPAGLVVSSPKVSRWCCSSARRIGPPRRPARTP